ARPPCQTTARAAQAGAGYLAYGAKEKLTVEQIAVRLEMECRQGIWRRTKEWTTLFNSLSPAEIGRLMKRVQHLVLAPAQEELRRALFARWAEGDPGAAVAFARGL